MASSLGLITQVKARTPLVRDAIIFSSADQRRDLPLRTRTQSKATRERVHAILRDRWPHLFTFPVPLCIDLHKQFLALSARPVGRNNFDRFLRFWTRQEAYRAAVAAGRARYDFDGRMSPMQPERKP